MPFDRQLTWRPYDASCGYFKRCCCFPIYLSIEGGDWSESLNGRCLKGASSRRTLFRNGTACTSGGTVRRRRRRKAITCFISNIMVCIKLNWTYHDDVDRFVLQHRVSDNTERTHGGLSLFHLSRNRRFPRSMRSQGERPVCGSHVSVSTTVTLRNVDGSLCHVQIWFVMGHQDQNGQNWRNISQFTMWLSQSSVNVYQTYQSLYQFQHFAAKCDSAMDKWCLPQ